MQKNILKDELKTQKENISSLEDTNRQAHVDLQDYQSKFKYCVKLEKEKGEIFKEKNKVLEQLMNDEKPVLKSNTNKRVFDITKDFCKQLDQRRISQAIDSKRGIVDFSSTQLFNTTLNSIKPSFIDKTYDSRAAMQRHNPKAYSSINKNMSKISHAGSQL
jgi:Zn-dependent M32 family carboxypeptidase